ncbi:MAG: TraR/DksA family transcriptional regulator [Simkaniaceae bacterium]
MALPKKKIEEFKKNLLEMKQQYSSVVRGVSQEVRSPEENKGFSQHSADEATDDATRMVSINVQSEEMRILDQIDRALEKIEEGTYGTCDASENEIPIKRLEAIPYATRTAVEQEKFEKGLS